MDTAAVCPHCRQQVHLEQGRFQDHFGLFGAWFPARRKEGFGELKRMVKTINDGRAS
jgi:hypothetical protein